jgi:hypothetical protein
MYTWSLAATRSTFTSRPRRSLAPFSSESSVLAPASGRAGLHVFPAISRSSSTHCPRINGPAPGWFSKSKVVGHVTMHLGVDIKATKNENGAHLHLSKPDGTQKDIHVDHIIAATGYKVQLQRLGFLDPDLRRQMKTFKDVPVLSTNFESSVPGLYLVGLAAAPSFGPLCRFAYGAKFTAPRIAKHLASTTG